MLFNGDRLPRQAARRLNVADLGARQRGGPMRPGSRRAITSAFAKASDDDRASALQMIELWVRGNRN